MIPMTLKYQNWVELLSEKNKRLINSVIVQKKLVTCELDMRIYYAICNGSQQRGYTLVTREGKIFLIKSPRKYKIKE